MGIIENIVDRCHVSATNRQVLRFTISRLVNGYKTFKSMSRLDRRSFIQQVLNAHEENKAIYKMVG